MEAGETKLSSNWRKNNNSYNDTGLDQFSSFGTQRMNDNYNGDINDYVDKSKSPIKK